MRITSSQLVEFFPWFASHGEAWRQQPWLVLGKGPSFAKLEQLDPRPYRTFGLNHVLEQVRVDVAHAIDIDVVLACAPLLDEQSGHLLMPWIPHVRNRPGSKNLLEWVDEIPALSALAAQGRLLWYNKTGSPPRGESPPVRVMNFSAEAPYALLGMAGVRTIRSLGVDGGASYAPSFSGLPTLLANGRDSFDSQFDEIARSIMAYGLDAAPLDVPSPVRVYVAATDEQALSVQVLEYSIRKHASMSVEVMPLYEAAVPIPQPKDRANRPRTPFSFQRFLIPQVAGYQGRAIYLDSDMQVFADIRGLWQQDMADHDLLSVAPEPGSGRLPQYSVMLLDCARLGWRIDEIVRGLDQGDFTYEALMQRMAVVERQAASIGPEWNSLERYIPGRTKLVHYTDMQTQPWIHALHPFGKLWASDLIEAVDSGFIALETVVEQARKGWIRPSLSYQVEHRIADAMLLPRKVLAQDEGYRAPYRSLPAARPARGIAELLRTMIEHAGDRSYRSLRDAKRKVIAVLGGKEQA